MSVHSSWYVYIIQTQCGKLYTGITTNIERRFQEHCDVYDARDTKGAKFFRGHKPEAVVYSEECNDRSGASKRECQIKAMRKQKKLALFMV